MVASKLSAPAPLNLALAFVLIIGLMTGVTLLSLEQLRSLNEKAELLRQKEIKTEHIHWMRNAVWERFIGRAPPVGRFNGRPACGR